MATEYFSPRTGDNIKSNSEKIEEINNKIRLLSAKERTPENINDIRNLSVKRNKLRQGEVFILNKKTQSERNILQREVISPDPRIDKINEQIRQLSANGGAKKNIKKIRALSVQRNKLRSNAGRLNLSLSGDFITINGIGDTKEFENSVSKEFRILKKNPRLTITKTRNFTRFYNSTHKGKLAEKFQGKLNSVHMIHGTQSFFDYKGLEGSLNRATIDKNTFYNSEELISMGLRKYKGNFFVGVNGGIIPYKELYDSKTGKRYKAPMPFAIFEAGYKQSIAKDIDFFIEAAYMPSMKTGNRENPTPKIEGINLGINIDF